MPSYFIVVLKVIEEINGNLIVVKLHRCSLLKPLKAQAPPDVFSYSTWGDTKVLFFLSALTRSDLQVAVVNK